MSKDRNGRWLQESQKQYKREWGRAKTAATRKSRTCVDCGSEFTSKAHNAKRCEVCRNDIRAMKSKEHLKELLAFRRSQDPASYIKRRRLAVRNKECCNLCALPFDYSHELDHITPLALGKRLELAGLDDWDNLQFICKQCHRQKTNGDVSLVAQVDRALSAEAA